MAAAKPSGPDQVDAYLAALDHPLKRAMEEARAALVGSDPAIGDHIKWNAPSFLHHGQDRATFNLRGDRLMLILHRGAKAKDGGGFAFADDSGLLTWLAPDRAALTIAGLDEWDVRRDEIVALIRRWMAATAE